MLLPLSSEKARTLSLENHMALAVVRSGHGAFDQIGCLLRTVYLAFYLRDETASKAELDLYRQAEIALDACVARAEQGEEWTLLVEEVSAIAHVLLLHDEQLATVPRRRYLEAWERLHRFVTGTVSSPISVEDAV
ncbi:hypothetical protein ACV229_40065 [Burkholderia sp. MR1-5-21]